MEDCYSELRHSEAFDKLNIPWNLSLISFHWIPEGVNPITLNSHWTAQVNLMENTLKKAFTICFHL